MGIDMDVVTVEDCIDMCRYKGAHVILSNGKVLGFRYERGGRQQGEEDNPE